MVNDHLLLVPKAQSRSACFFHPLSAWWSLFLLFICILINFFQRFDYPYGSLSVFLKMFTHFGVKNLAIKLSGLHESDRIVLDSIALFEYAASPKPGPQFLFS